MELSEARDRLDRIDSGMIELFEHRMAIVSQIAEYKQDHNMPVRDEARENEIINAVRANAEEQTLPYAVRLIEAVISLSCDYQTDIRKNKGKNR